MEEVFFVICFLVDDCVEVLEGFDFVVIGVLEYLILKGFGKDWFYLFGFNEVKVKDGVEVLVMVLIEYGSFFFFVMGIYGKGRMFVWILDVGFYWFFL